MRLEPYMPPEIEWSAEDRFAYALSGLSWAVGHLDGQGIGDNYARRVLDRLTNPVVLLPPGDSRD
jgi:hypothetical protein